MIEVKQTVAKLYSFISKMMLLVEDDLNNFDIINADDKCKAKKNITNIFEKLVSLVMQLNRLSKDEQMHITETLPEEDMKIIERFLAKHSSKE